MSHRRIAMHKYLIYLFSLSSSLCSYGSSWADIAKGKAPQKNQSAPLQKVTDPLMLIDIGNKALHENQSAITILSILNPIFAMPTKPNIKSLAFNMIACAFGKEKNANEELVFLCNELAVSYNEGLLLEQNNTLVFPEHQLYSVHRLCNLFANGHLATFENVYQNDTDKNFFFDTIIHSGHLSGNPDATLLLAQSAEKSGDYARAVELYNALPMSYSQPLRAKITVTILLHAEKNPSLLTKLFEKISTDTDLQNAVTKLLSEKKLNNIAQSFWEYTYKTRSGKNKAIAAFELNNLLRHTNQKMADIYLCVAAASGNNDACKLAFNLGLCEPDETKSIKYFEAAALGKHIGALLKCGNYYKNIANKNETNAQQATAYLKKAKTYLEQAAALNSPAARLEIAIMPAPSAHMIQALETLTKDQNFPLKADAQYYLGKILLKIGQYHNKKSGNIAERNAYFKKAETLLQQSAHAGNTEAKIAYPLCLLKKANFTQSKKQLELLNRIEILLQNELASPSNKQKALIGLAKLNHFKKNLPLTIDLFLESYRLDPHNPNTSDAIAQIVEKMRTNKDFEYIHKLSHAMKELNPKCPLADLNLGIVALEHDNNIPLARKHFKDAGKLGSSTAYKNLGITYFNNATTHHDYERACKYYERALILSPNESDLMHLLGHTYHALKNYVEAKKYFSQGASYDNPDAIAGLANYWHRGFAGPNDPMIAHKLYKQAATKYLVQGNAERSNFCTHMSYILEQQDYKVSVALSDSKTFIAEFRQMIHDLKKIAHLPNQNPTLVNEAWYALAFQYKCCATHYGETTKKKELCLLALKMIDLMPNQAHLEGQLLKANIIQQLMIQKLLDRNVPDENNLAETIATIYEKTITNLEQNRPLSQILIDTYNRYGAYQLHSANNPEKALQSFHIAATNNSVEAMLHLSIFYQKRNPTEAHMWLGKALAIDPNSPLVQSVQKCLHSPNETIEASSQTLYE